VQLIEDMKDMHNSSSLLHLLRASWAFWAVGLVFAVGTFLSLFSLTEGAHGLEIGLLIAAGIVGGGLIRGLVRERWVVIILVLVVAAEVFLLSQSTDPWSVLWPVLIPASATGVMVGNIMRLCVVESRRQVTRDVWVVNGVEMPLTDGAKSASLASLASWNSAEAGRFFVERNEGLFEAMGSPATGFIVHCAASFREEGEWRMLGSVDGNEETKIRIPSGAAHAPSGAVVDLETAGRALGGFFHYRGPDPELAWASGDAALDLKFG
jgi:hypothetical protein